MRCPNDFIPPGLHRFRLASRLLLTLASVSNEGRPSLSSSPVRTTAPNTNFLNFPLFLVASLLLVPMPGAPSSFSLLAVFLPCLAGRRGALPVKRVIGLSGSSLDRCCEEGLGGHPGLGQCSWKACSWFDTSEVGTWMSVVLLIDHSRGQIQQPAWTLVGDHCLATQKTLVFTSWRVFVSSPEPVTRCWRIPSEGSYSIEWDVGHGWRIVSTGRGYFLVIKIILSR